MTVSLPSSYFTSPLSEVGWNRMTVSLPSSYFTPPLSEVGWNRMTVSLPSSYFTSPLSEVGWNRMTPVQCNRNPIWLSPRARRNSTCNSPNNLTTSPTEILLQNFSYYHLHEIADFKIFQTKIASYTWQITTEKFTLINKNKSYKLPW